MSYSKKILPFDTASDDLAAIRDLGNTIVHCHGTFDLIHPGHIVHFQEAKALGDILVVTITSEEHVNKGPGRPYFNNKLRCLSLASLDVVDYVVIIPFPAAVEAIDCVCPNIYCKGKEYEKAENDVTGNIRDDIDAVKRIGGKIKYIGSVVFSSTKLINNNFSHVTEEAKGYCRSLSKEFPPETFRKIVEDFSNLRILVLGDAIFDKYTYVKVQGLTSKNRILSSRFQQDSLQLGGSLAIFRHIKQFCPKTELSTLLGAEDWIQPAFAESDIQLNGLSYRDPQFTSIVKQRFVEDSKRSQELGKIYSINYIDANYDSRKPTETLINALASRIKDFDMVVVSDFGHGLMTDALRDFIQSEAPFLALNCQTNSYNHGTNLISRQYHRADAFTLDEQELMLDRGKRQLSPSQDLGDLRRQMSSHMGWLTRGASLTVGLDSLGSYSECPRLENQVVDTIGAGDAFFALASIAAKCDLPIALGTFLGQLAGAQAVKTIGNTDCVSKAKLLKGGMTLLSF